MGTPRPRTGPTEPYKNKSKDRYREKSLKLRQGEERIKVLFDSFSFKKKNNGSAPRASRLHPPVSSDHSVSPLPVIGSYNSSRNVQQHDAQVYRARASVPGTAQNSKNGHQQADAQKRALERKARETVSHLRGHGSVMTRSFSVRAHSCHDGSPLSLKDRAIISAKYMMQKNSTLRGICQGHFAASPHKTSG